METKKQVKEGNEVIASDNELIAEVMNANDALVIALFDGWKYYTDKWEYPTVWIEKNFDGVTKSIQIRRSDKTFVSSYPTLKYSTSWEWIHPVWDKFKAIKLDDLELLVKARMTTLKFNISAAISYGTIEDAFKELSQAITWYNSIKKA